MTGVPVLGPRLAIVGPGAMAEVHAPLLKDLGCAIDVVIGPIADAVDFADRHGIPGHEATLNGALASHDVDAVVICSPSAVHAEQAIRCLSAGRHVLCEIPVGLMLAEGEAVARAAATAGKHAMVAHTMRYWSPVAELRRLADEAGFRPTHLVARLTMLRQTNTGWTGRKRDWTDNVLWHHGGHVVDTALLLLREPIASVQPLRGPDWAPSGNHMDVGLVLATASGALATIALSYHARIERNDYLVIGEDETYEVIDGRLLSSAGTLVDDGSVADVQAAAVRAQDARFVDCISGKATPYPTVADILPTLRVLEAARLYGRRWQDDRRELAHRASANS